MVLLLVSRQPPRKILPPGCLSGISPGPAIKLMNSFKNRSNIITENFSENAQWQKKMKIS